MRLFQFTQATSAAQASQIARTPEARFIAGGTTLLDLMKLEVERPSHLVDVNRLDLAKIDRVNGGLKIGALVRNSDLAHDPTVVRDYPVLSQSILAGASAQIRNMATTAGNLLQRTRCMYFRSTVMACNKRVPGSGCSAIDGENRTLAILGGSPSCIATNPSDMNVALAALEATVQIQGSRGERSVRFPDFHLPPGTTPQRETVLEPGDLVTSVTLPPPRPGARSLYLKLRDRASYEFALASAAVIVETTGGKFTFVRIAMGGVGTVPWRFPDAETALVGAPVALDTIQKAAELALRDAKPQSQNGFKVTLARRCLAHALALATGLAKGSTP